MIISIVRQFLSSFLSLFLLILHHRTGEQACQGRIFLGGCEQTGGVWGETEIDQVLLVRVTVQPCLPDMALVVLSIIFFSFKW